MIDISEQFNDHKERCREVCNRVEHDLYGRDGVLSRLEGIHFQLNELTADNDKVMRELYGNGSMGIKEKVSGLVNIEHRLVQLQYILLAAVLGGFAKVVHDLIVK